MEERKKSKVAWSGRNRGQGNASTETEIKLINLLDEIGLAIEQQAEISELDIFNFFIFREFEVVGAVTADKIFYYISPLIGGGFTLVVWYDFRQAPKQPTQDQLDKWVERKFGWKEACVIEVDSKLLDLPPYERRDEIQKVAKYEVEEMIKEKERQARLVRVKPIFGGREFFVEDKLCFVLMPIKEPFLTFYKDHIKPILEGLGLTVKNANDVKRSGPIIEDIWEYINKSQLIVADVTGGNANVLYELGIAHTIGKDYIILTWNKDDAAVPFDIKHLRYFSYTDSESGWEILRNTLREVVHEKIH